MATAIFTHLRKPYDSYLQRRRLWRELAGCDMADLQAAMARSDGDNDARIWRIVAAQRALDSFM
jgi:hypothetical protein